MYLQNNTTLQSGRYQIVRHISSGGFGNTYEGLHIMLDKRVAIKEFFVKDFCNRDETTAQVTTGITSKTALVDKLRKKFIDEARSLCTLEHPHIVHVYDVFEENGTAYYVMDFIDGSSLNDIVKKEGRLSEKRALKYIRQVADALKYVHENNRLHLDIKPANIMIDKHDNAYLIDFGASKQYDEEAGENTSTLIGKTPGYAPLEQLGNDVVKFTPATDIYALGATLYKLLSDITPPSATLLASGEDLEPLPSSVSSSVVTAIKKAMSINKKNRPQSIAEFINLFGAKPVAEPKKEQPHHSTIEDDERTIYAEEPTSKTSSIYSGATGYKETPYKVEELTPSSSTTNNYDYSSSNVKVTETKGKKKNLKFVWIAVIACAMVIVSIYVGTSSINTTTQIMPSDAIQNIKKQPENKSIKEQLFASSPVVIDEPIWDGKILPSQGTSTVKLKQKSLNTNILKNNNVSNLTKYLEQNDFSLPTFNRIPLSVTTPIKIPNSIPYTLNDLMISCAFKYNDFHIYLYGEHKYESNKIGRDPLIVVITDTEDKNVLHYLDFTKFKRAPKVGYGSGLHYISDEKYSDCVDQGIYWAQIDKNILYISHRHSTYAASSCGHNAYISAVSLSDYKILWTSKPLSCNTKNFLIVDNSIISGYGFTEESHYILVLDKMTGQQKQKLTNRYPEYIFKKSNEIYVITTYDKEYVYSID